MNDLVGRVGTFTKSGSLVRVVEVYTFENGRHTGLSVVRLDTGKPMGIPLDAFVPETPTERLNRVTREALIRDIEDDFFHSYDDRDGAPEN